jgi:hypothetical protein
MKNNINNKKERDAKSILITLGKASDGYYYHGDSLTERSKIKIPLDELAAGRGEFQMGSYNGSTDIIRDKLERPTCKVESGIPFTDEIKAENMSQSGNLIQEEMPLLAKLVEKNYKQPIILPSCAQWFKFDEIHEIEMKSLPEFFCGKYPSKTPDMYKEYRNFIINLSRENTNSYLSATSKIFILI